MLDPNMRDDEKQRIVKISLDELVRVYSHVSHIYDQLRAKALGLIAGEVAIVGFIFSGADARKIPLESDRRIFFFTAILFLMIAFGILLWIISTVTWKVPHDLEQTKALTEHHATEAEYLQYLHDDYVTDCKYNWSVITPKMMRMNTSIYLLSAGAIILLVLKYGG